MPSGSRSCRRTIKRAVVLFLLFFVLNAQRCMVHRCTRTARPAAAVCGCTQTGWPAAASLLYAVAHDVLVADGLRLESSRAHSALFSKGGTRHSGGGRTEIHHEDGDDGSWLGCGPAGCWPCLCLSLSHRLDVDHLCMLKRTICWPGFLTLLERNVVHCWSSCSIWWGCITSSYLQNRHGMNLYKHYPLYILCRWKLVHPKNLLW